MLIIWLFMKDPLKKENKHLQNLKSQISSNFTLNFNQTFYNISSIEKVKGNVKADFALYDKDVPVIFISHKDGKTMKQFQQFSGISDVASHPFVYKFIEDLRYNFPNGVPKGFGTVSSKKIDQEISENRKLLHKCIFGIDHGNPYNENNVHVVIQGNMNLVNINNVYSLVSDSFVLLNNNNNEQRLPFETKIMAMYRKDRNNQNLKQTRIMVCPENSRKIKVEL